jgi:ribose/xylose/arabinose/galactoside ABC-type transport system permease subunit
MEMSPKQLQQVGSARTRTSGLVGCAPDSYLTRVGVQKILILLGLVMVVAGVAWPWLRKLPLGRLPGDIHIVKHGFSFHFPIVTCLVISAVVSIVLWIFRR